MSRISVSAVDKMRLIDAYRENRDYYEVAETLGIARGTAYHIIRRFKNSGEVGRRRGGANNRKTDEEMINTVVSIVEDNPILTLSQINDELRIRMPSKPRVCDNTISSMLAGQLITLKMSRDVPTQRHTAQVKGNVVSWPTGCSKQQQWKKFTLTRADFDCGRSGLTGEHLEGNE